MVATGRSGVVEEVYRGRVAERKETRQAWKEIRRGSCRTKKGESEWLGKGMPVTAVTGDGDRDDGRRRVVDREVEVRRNGEEESVSFSYGRKCLPEAPFLRPSSLE